MCVRACVRMCACARVRVCVPVCVRMCACVCARTHPHSRRSPNAHTLLFPRNTATAHTHISPPLDRRRSPDDAKIKQKMIYASSKDAIRKALVGISSEIQGTDVSEVDYQTGQCARGGERK